MDNETTTPIAGGEPALLRVERGSPTAEELAALTAVVMALGAEADGARSAADEATSRAERLRRQTRRGRQLAGLPGSWRSGRF
ncbi:acyl-CoA carboxylase subunit epsilon [Arthrobacter sp. KK5.5]|uniref:acyl-CoA carboxylase subunit epsilon n=1 Tax=Arthrobacter sp. KK5.5 TaxID=3373084 RepID=UPI003EE492F7